MPFCQKCVPVYCCFAQIFMRRQLYYALMCTLKALQFVTYLTDIIMTTSLLYLVLPGFSELNCDAEATIFRGFSNNYLKSKNAAKEFRSNFHINFQFKVSYFYTNDLSIYYSHHAIGLINVQRSKLYCSQQGCTL